MIYVCFVYYAAIAQVWINIHRQNVFYTVILWYSYRKRTKKPWRKRQSGSWRFSFHKYFHNFFLLISFFQLFYFILVLRSAPLEGRTCFCELYQICCSKRFNNDLSWKPTNRYNQKRGRTKRTRIRGKGWEKMARKRMKMMSMWASVELGSGVRSSVKPRPDRLRESGQSTTQMQDINNLV